jgi:hypothetical protein
MADNLEDAAIQAAETLQTASINHAPSRNDIAPETSVDKKVPVEFDRSGDVESVADDVEDNEVPLSALRPVRGPERHSPKHLQLPDLRFEQSYLKSIGEAKDWKMVAFITVKDQVRLSTGLDEEFAIFTVRQVVMPLIQGMAWTLIVAGYTHVTTHVEKPLMTSLANTLSAGVIPMLRPSSQASQWAPKCDVGGESLLVELHLSSLQFDRWPCNSIFSYADRKIGRDVTDFLQVGCQ